MTHTHTLASARSQRGLLQALFVLVVLAALGAAGYLAIAYHFAYCKGESVGYVQKISYKGWICKTWEGEQVRALAAVPTVPEKFAFTVRDSAVVDTINQSIGKKVVLEYEQHKGLPSCFGDTEHFVTGAKVAPE